MRLIISSLKRTEDLSEPTDAMIVLAGGDSEVIQPKKDKIFKS